MSRKRGRPPKGLGHVEGLEGDEHDKGRLRIILATVTGDIANDEACAMLGIGPSQLARLRERALSGALAALAPRPPGRPSAEEPVPPGRIAELEQEVQDLKVDLRAAQIREEIAAVMPSLLVPASEKKSTERNRRKRQHKKRRKK